VLCGIQNDLLQPNGGIRLIPPDLVVTLHQAFLNGLALFYNLVPCQRRAQHAGRCGVEGEGKSCPPAIGC
jgi:hypothetical protein